MAWGRWDRWLEISGLGYFAWFFQFGISCLGSLIRWLGKLGLHF